MINEKIKNKILTNITKNGKKFLSENILLKSFKEIQKTTTKQTKEVLRLSIISASPIFRIYKLKDKKKKKKKKYKKTREIPGFYNSTGKRTAAAIKNITRNSNEFKNFFKSFCKEVILSAQNKSISVQNKNSLQKQVLLIKHLFKFYKW